MSKTPTASERSALIRLASSLPNGDGHRRAILAAVSKQAGPKVTRSKGGFEVKGGDWPQFILDLVIKGPYFPASRPPDTVEGIAHYHVRLRSPDAWCLSYGDIQMLWRTPVSLEEGAKTAYFDPMGRSLEDFTALFGRTSVVSVKGGKYHVQFANPINRQPVEGLIRIDDERWGLDKKAPLTELKRDGVLEDAPVQIGGSKVGTVLVPKGLAPELGDLRGLFK
jgi:hypothetical protein